MPSVHVPTPEEAAAALAELDAGRRTVAAAAWRGQPMLLAAWSALTLVDYAAKDVLAGRSARWAVTAACQLAGVGLGLLDVPGNSVNPVSTDPADLGPRAATPLVVAVAGWALAERLLVNRLRRGRLRRPNLLAGAVLAAVRPAGVLGVRRLLPRPHRG